MDSRPFTSKQTRERNKKHTSSLFLEAIHLEPLECYSGSKSICRENNHKLILNRKYSPLFACFNCKGNHSGYALTCSICYLVNGSVCEAFKPEIIHPFHLAHPLTLCSKEHVPRSDQSTTQGSYGICNCCGRRLGERYYHCSLCNYCIDAFCTIDPLKLTIAHPRSHKHALTLFPGRFSWPCSACGKSLDDAEDHVYTCLPCSYMVHKTCIYLPRVIKITRHQHRLSYSSFLPPGELSCGVCRQTVDINYGQYSCTKGCPYVVHSKCATREDVWDGEDLEGVPEEPEEDVEPYVRIDDETIQHFSHEHYLKLHSDYIPSGNQYMFCQVCTLPIITSASFYSCMECDFVLDEACACLPRKTHHLLHKHPLILIPLYLPTLYDTFNEEGIFTCNSCMRATCGFVYRCSRNKCEFQLDTRCASLPDPFIHDFHLCDHPLFFNLINDDERDAGCMACKEFLDGTYVPQCMECKIILCIACATIPRVSHYKHDSHPLTLCYGEEDPTYLQYWCEICESKLDASKWFYTCDYCKVTLHLTCLLGEDPYMKPNKIFTRKGNEIEVSLNGNRRPFCEYCALRCVEPFIFKSQDKTFCSYYCTILQSERRSFLPYRELRDGRRKLGGEL